ncbi:hypothetical protein BKI52_15380 [marine bacterium AO1-C]|nr:hypothetical protein BKI52_15380 [marine bacterium AO1-C]
MQKSASAENQSEQNAQQQVKPTVQAKSPQTQSNGQINTMFGPKPPIQTKAGRKGPVQAKQSPIQRNQNKSNDLKSVMGNQYGVDLSGYTEHKDSSFPGQVGAQATIQGKNIHYAPGQFTLQNRKHELGHAIDNTKNGTPKGDMNVGGHSVDTTREAAADKIMNAPLQMKAEGETTSQSTQASSTSSNAPIQMLRKTDMPELITRIERRIRTTLPVDEDQIWKELISRVIRDNTHNFHHVSDLGFEDAINLVTPYLSTYFQMGSTRGRAVSTDTALSTLRDLGMDDERIKHLMLHPDKLAYFEEVIGMEGYDSELPAANTFVTRSNARGYTLQSHQQQNDESSDHFLKRIVASGELALPGFTTKMNDVEQKLVRAGIHAHAYAATRKKYKRAKDKYNQYPDGALDIVRGSIVFNSIKDLIHAQSMLSSMFHVIKTYGNLGDSKVTYQDFKMLVRLEGGHIAEVQLHLNAMTQAKYEQGGEELYNISRLNDPRVPADTTYKPEPENKGKSLRQLQTIVDQLEAVDAVHYQEHIAFIMEMRDKIDRDVAITKGDVTDERKGFADEISRIIYQGAKDLVDAQTEAGDRKGRHFSEQLGALGSGSWHRRR